MSNGATSAKSKTSTDNIPDALEWFFKSQDAQNTSISFDRETILREIERIPSCGRKKDYCKEWTTLAFNLYFPDAKTAKGKATVKAKDRPSPREGITKKEEFSCKALETYYRQDFTELNDSLNDVRESVETLLPSFTEWLNARHEYFPLEDEVSSELDWNYLLPLNELELSGVNDQRRLLLSSLTLGKKGFTISKSEVYRFRGLFDLRDSDEASVLLEPHLHFFDCAEIDSDDEDYDISEKNSLLLKHQTKTFLSDLRQKRSASISPYLMPQDFEVQKDKLNESIKQANETFLIAAREKVKNVWTDMPNFIGFLRRTLQWLDDVLGEDSVTKVIADFCVTNEAEGYFPFEMYWQPLNDLYKSKNRKDLEAAKDDIETSIHSYFDAYERLLDRDVLKEIPLTVATKLQEFLNAFKSDFRKILQSMQMPYRPEVCTKIIKESVASFEGLVKVAKARMTSTIDDLFSKSILLLEDIDDVRDQLCGDDFKTAASFLEKINRRETKRRMTKIDKAWSTMVRTCKHNLAACFPVAHLVLVFYMMFKLFTLEKIHQEEKVLKEIGRLKLSKMSKLLQSKDLLQHLRNMGLEKGCLRVSMIVLDLTKKEISTRFSCYLSIEAEKKALLLVKEAEAAKAKTVDAFHQEQPHANENEVILSNDATSSKKKKKNKKGKSKSVLAGTPEEVVSHADDKSMISTEDGSSLRPPKSIKTEDDILSQTDSHPYSINAELEHLSRINMELKHRNGDLEDRVSYLEEKLTQASILQQQSEDRVLLLAKQYSELMEAFKAKDTRLVDLERKLKHYEALITEPSVTYQSPAASVTPPTASSLNSSPNIWNDKPYLSTISPAPIGSERGSVFSSVSTGSNYNLNSNVGNNSSLYQQRLQPPTIGTRTGTKGFPGFPTGFNANDENDSVTINGSTSHLNISGGNVPGFFW
ncbi:hypothetical protein MP638_000281 [Amoeboaphelidium occidentale]|nr:hypothetical protein MP638_000281 [Amoeboaphelidium occidentale]